MIAPRERLRRFFAHPESEPPPRHEAEFAPDTWAAWAAEGAPQNQTPEQFFRLDVDELAGLAWERKGSKKEPLTDKSALERFRRGYDPQHPERFPPDWAPRAARWHGRQTGLYAEAWCEGFFQAIGIADGASLEAALTALCEAPHLAEAAMEHYAHFVTGMIERMVDSVELDYVYYYEPIASNHGPVISPAAYRRFVCPALARISACLEKHGVRQRLMWSAGAVQAFIPLWLDAGVTGLYLNQTGQAGISYRALRHRFGSRLLLLGGIDWRMPAHRPEDLPRYLEAEVRPLLAAGNYIPFLDDTIRAYMPFDRFRAYREQLDAQLNDVFGIDL